ncbi:hypothetical protein HPB50_004118 [Hyalomma asiaticum]|uniref:Uncharacterized protein n=1 Tax=Hyalomma asiaticum TaxID=266040 RepID=A0ACB7RHK7_HYAAI|nr:hypothetical protein HPB50_004118 [Hyalomma asiaticum]
MNIPFVRSTRTTGFADSHTWTDRTSTEAATTTPTVSDSFSPSLEGEELLPQSFFPVEDRCSNLETGEICFRGGDERVNEHPALTSMHTVWLRQHNRIARRLQQLNTHWDDERLFQETRRIVGAQWQHIIYSEWLPPILGPDAMVRYQLVPTGRSRYAPDVDATVLNEFAAAAFRLGHTLIDGVFQRIDIDGQRSPFELQDFYFFPFYLYHGDMDNIIRGLLRHPGQHYDSFITEGVTHHLYRLRNDSYGLDLIALNLQRGREHGLRPYVDYLQYCTGYQATTFEDLLQYTPAHIVQLYSTLYDDVTDIDLFTGGITETSVQGGLVGPTFACILGQQFRRLKFGDRFYYEHEGQAGSFAPEQLQEIRKTTLAHILCDNCYSLSSVQIRTVFRPDVTAIGSLGEERRDGEIEGITARRLRLAAPPVTAASAALRLGTRRKPEHPIAIYDGDEARLV